MSRLAYPAPTEAPRRRRRRAACRRAGILPHRKRLSYRYNTMTANVGPFGRGTYLNYDWQARFSTQAITLITPQGVRYNLALDADGTYRATPGRAGGLPGGVF